MTFAGIHMKQQVQEIKALFNSPKKVVITTHINPDGDALGSSLGLCHFLRMQGHDARIVSPTNYPDFLKWLPGNDYILHYPIAKARSQQLVNEADIVFCLDFNNLTRIGELGHYIHQCGAKKIVIDHHQQPDDFADILISDTAASSTSELIYVLMEEWEGLKYLNQNIAVCLYTGILTDTGAFQYPATTSRVHDITSNLIAKGVQVNDVYQRIYNSFTENRLRLFGYCITEKMKVFPELKTAYIALTQDDLVKFNVQSGDTEGLVNFPLKIADINFSTLISDRTEIIKLSFRSKGSFDVNQFSRSHFSGGGHVNASGGGLKLKLDEVIEKFEITIPTYKNQLDY